jgi:hypothetical protein
MIMQPRPQRAGDRPTGTNDRIPNMANASSYHDDAELRSPVVDRILARLRQRRGQSRCPGG